MTESVRAKVPWFSLVLLLLVVLSVLLNALLTVLPFHVPTARERQRDEQLAIAAARHTHLAALLAEGDHCRPAVAHEIARALVFDGRSARAYADDYEQRCGADLVIRHWGDAPQPRSIEVSQPSYSPPASPAASTSNITTSWM